MPDKIENDLDAYWDALRKRNSDVSFPAMAAWIRQLHKTVGRSRLEKGRRKRRSGSYALAMLALVLIISCTIRINRVESSGSLVNFGIDKKENGSIQKLSSLQQLFTFRCYEFLKPDQPAIAFFIFFIPDKEKEKLGLITGQLKILSGLQKLDISSITYTIRESLFASFWHKTLGKQQTPKGEELTRNIQATLKNKGLGFLSTSILNDKDGNVAFAAASHTQDSLTTTNKPVEKQKAQNDKIVNLPPGVDKLEIFNWLFGSWKVKYVTQTYHYWLKINDSLLMCFIIKYQDEELIKFGDDGPDISVGFSIRHSASDSVILSLRGIEWKFLSANNREVRFKNETTPKSANVKWVLANDKKSWQSAISGESNLEVVNLVREENTDLENTVKKFIAKNPDIIKRS